MTNYNNGKIYKIESTLGDKVYYGSTTKQYLSQRMTYHRNHYNTWLKGKAGLVMAFKLFDEYGLENCKIVLVENYPCNSKDELAAQEAHYIRNFECINKNIPNRKMKEWRKDNKDNIRQYYKDNKNKILEQQKQYRENNKNKIAEQQKQYYEDNKNKIAEQQKQYYEDNKNKIAEQQKQYYENNKKYHEVNKDKISEKAKKYYEDNKNKILERTKIKYTCICGSCIRKADKAQHERSKKHIKFLESQ
jgi:hypothetical protein